jgi:hypothetical protein
VASESAQAEAYCPERSVPRYDSGLFTEAQSLEEQIDAAFDLGYQTCLRDRHLTWNEAKELEAYRKLGTYEELKAALDKQRNGN